jgi:hypothetical protein
MRATLYGFILGTGANLSQRDFFEFIKTDPLVPVFDNSEHTTFIHIQPNGIVLGVIITSLPGKVGIKTETIEGRKKVSKVDLAGDGSSSAFNFFMFNLSSGRGSFQTYKGGMSLDKLHKYLMHWHNHYIATKIEEVKSSNLDDEIKHTSIVDIFVRNRNQLSFHVIARKKSFYEIVSQFDSIERVEVPIAIPMVRDERLPIEEVISYRKEVIVIDRINNPQNSKVKRKIFEWYERLRPTSPTVGGTLGGRPTVMKVDDEVYEILDSIPLEKLMDMLPTFWDEYVASEAMSWVIIKSWKNRRCLGLKCG